MDLFSKSVFSLNTCIFCNKNCGKVTSGNGHFICGEDEKERVKRLVFSRDGSKGTLHKFFWHVLLGSSINKGGDDSLRLGQTSTADPEKVKCEDVNPLPVCTPCLETAVSITRLHADLERVQMLLIDQFSKIQKTVTSARNHFVKREEHGQKSSVNVLHEFQEKVFMQGEKSTKIPLVLLERFHNDKLPEFVCVKQEPLDGIHNAFPNRCTSNEDDEWSPTDSIVGFDENSDGDPNDTGESDQEYIPPKRLVGRTRNDPNQKRPFGRPRKDPTEKRAVERPHKAPIEKLRVGKSTKRPLEKRPVGRPRKSPENAAKYLLGRSLKLHRLAIRKNPWRPPNAVEVPDERKKHFHTFYRCDLCGKKYCKQTSFLKHKRLHEELDALNNELESTLGPELASSKETNTCKICQQDIHNSDYHEHLLSHEDEIGSQQEDGDERKLPFACSHKDCLRKFHIKENLKIHMDVDHDEMSSAESLLEVKKCDVCFMCYNTSSDLLDHFKKAHKDYKSRNLYYCPVCAHSYSIAENLISHMYTHQNEDQQICFICKEVSPNRAELLAHIEKWHALKTKADCETCGEKFDDIYRHRSHLKTTHKRKDTFICSFCGKICYFAADFMRHMSIHKKVERRGIFCEICNSSFITADKLLYHQIKFHGAPKLPCMICKGEYSSQKALLHHMRLHNNKDGYKCEVCGKLFNHKAGLQSHMYVHNNEKPYTCEICGFASKTQHCLSRHLDSHEKRFVCNICGRKFTRKYGLETHSKMHTNETLVCTYCGYEFHNRKSLKCHVKTYHETDNPRPLYKAQKKRQPCTKWKDAEGNVQHAKSALQMGSTTETESTSQETAASSSNVGTAQEEKFYRQWEMPFDFRM